MKTMQQKDRDNRINELRKLLNIEWSKPKYRNLLKDKKGNVIDTREPRNYDTIESIQTEIGGLTQVKRY